MQFVECDGCDGKCCRKPDIYIPLTEKDLERVPNELVEEGNGRYSMISDKTGCSALDRNGRCSIHDLKPTYCKLWPIQIEKNNNGPYGSVVKIPRLKQCPGRGVQELSVKEKEGLFCELREEIDEISEVI